MVNSNPTQLSTVNDIFIKSLDITDEVETECIVLTFNLTFHAEAQKLHWNDTMYMQRTVVRLGKLHIPNGIFQCYYKERQRFRLADILLEAGTVAHGSQLGVTKRRHYNRSVRVIKIMAEALRKKPLSTFMDTQSDVEKDKSITWSKNVHYVFFPKHISNTSAHQVILKSLKAKWHYTFRRDAVNFQLLHFG